MNFQKLDFSLTNVSYLDSFDQVKTHLVDKPIGYSDNFTLYSDGSKSQEGDVANSILINPKWYHFFLSCILKFICTNSLVEYEALLQGLKNEIDTKIREPKILGYSEIIVKHVKNPIH